MGNFCCNEVAEKHNQNMIAEEYTKTGSKKYKAPVESRNLFTVVEVVGDDTSQSSVLYSTGKTHNLM